VNFQWHGSETIKCDFQIHADANKLSLLLTSRNSAVSDYSKHPTRWHIVVSWKRLSSKKHEKVKQKFHIFKLLM